MNLSASDLIDAKEITAELLDQLGLDAYMYEVEPREGPWEVNIECAHTGGWQTIQFSVERDKLLACRSNSSDRDALLRDWGEHLSECRRSPTDENV